MLPPSAVNLKAFDNKLVIIQDGKTIFSQLLYLNEVVTEYSYRQVKVAPQEQKQLFIDEEAEFVFIWVSWESDTIEKPLLVQQSGYDQDGVSTDFLNANWEPLYNFKAISSIPNYGISDMNIKNLNDAPTSQSEDPKTARVLVFTAKTV